MRVPGVVLAAPLGAAYQPPLSVVTLPAGVAVQPLPLATPLVLPAAASAAATPAAPKAQAAEGKAKPIEKTMAALAAPSVIQAAAKGGSDASRGAAAADFEVRMGAKASAATVVSAPSPGQEGNNGLLAPTGSRKKNSPVVARAVPKQAEKRSSSFPIAMAIGTAIAAAALYAISALVSGITPLGDVAAPTAGVISMFAGGVAAVAGLLGVLAIVDTVIFAVSVARGKDVTNEEFTKYLRAEAAAGRLDPGLIALVRPYRPRKGTGGLTFGFASGGFIYLRPELVAAPWLLRRVLVHEHHHLKSLKARGPPPRTLLGGIWARFKSEVSARLAEIAGGRKAAAAVRVPVLERALRQAQLSLRLDESYEMLVINPSTEELKDSAVYKGLSGDKARVESVTAQSAQEALKATKRYRAVVLDQAASQLPGAEGSDRLKLDLALKQLDSLFILATRRVRLAESGFKAGSDEARRYAELATKAELLGRGPSAAKGTAQLEQQIKQMWRDLAAIRLKGLGVTSLVENLYGGLENKGLAFLAFNPGEAGVETWEKLLRYWEGPDGGQFRVTRVDLESGGHVLVLRKIESRVGLWLSPLLNNTIKTSVPDAMGSPERRAAARAALAEAGFGDELKRFDELGVEINQVFGADVARQEIYVTVPRRNAAQIRKFVVASADQGIQPSVDGFKPELNDAPALHRAPAVWKLGITGDSETILWIDTGGDASHEDFQGRLDRVDMVHEGPEDWIGHGTHVAGISISGGSVFTGLARGAKGIMAKVFGRDTPGAADGPIMGAGTIGLQKGVTVISASLGVKGNSGSNLASFFSQLTHQPNSKGEYVTVVASAGNAGPFDRTLSQPSAGADVLSVAAAAKSKDDGVPEIAFFSSSGPDIDSRYSVKRLRFAPKLTAIGGDVVTDPGDPNVYKHGVFSTKSKDMPPAYADTPDKAHTGMSGTSMAAPAAAGIALLVRAALRLTGVKGEDVPLIVRSIMMRTAVDMKLPLWYQGAGLADAFEAVLMALSAAGTGLRARLSLIPGLRWLAPQAGPDAFDWVRRYKAVLELEDQVYLATQLAKTQAQARFDDTEGREGGSKRSNDGDEEPGFADDSIPESKVAHGNIVAEESRKKFAAERDKALPALKKALKDEVWLVRMQAALTLLNMRSPDAWQELLEAALHDADGRVRQMAFLALAEHPTHLVDTMLQKASNDADWRTAMYSAWALGRRGDRGGIARLVTETQNADKKARYSAVWLLGQIGARATAAEAEALSAKVLQASERGNIRHLAAAALTNLASSAPSSLSGQVVKDLLAAAGTDNLALTRTISKFFPEAANDKGFAARLKEEPLKSAVTDWVLKNRGAVAMPGALGELVGLLARLLGISLDDPTPTPDPTGQGVKGVDAALGSLDLVIVLPPERAPKEFWDSSKGGDASKVLQAAGLDAAAMGKLEASLKAAMPLSGALWLSVPEHKLYAFRVEMERQGLAVRMPHARYSAAKRESDAASGGVTLELGEAPLATIPEGADLSLVRLRAGRGASEAAVMAALESVAAASKSGTPTVISLDAVGQAPRGKKKPSALSALAGMLVLGGLGVVVPSGNEGPRPGSVATPGLGLGVVVAAATKAAGLQVYSGRGRSGEAPISWADLVDDGSSGTGEAAERSAAKLTVLAKTMAAAYEKAGKPLPAGWFLLLRSLVERSLTPMEGRGAHEVGGGLFDDAAKAQALLNARLQDLDGASKEADALLVAAKKQATGKLLGEAGETVFTAAKSALLAAWDGPIVDSAAKWVYTTLGLDGAKPESLEPEAKAWWQDGQKRAAVSVPVYALRRGENDPGAGKLTDLGRYYEQTLAPQGAKVVLLLPHFGTTEESPYAPASLYAINEDMLDWAAVDEVRARPELLGALRAPAVSVDYPALRAREGAVRLAAWKAFESEHIKKGTERGQAFKAFLENNAAWLDEYAEHMSGGFQDETAARRYAQWQAALQLKAALDRIHAAGGKVLFDIPMFRAKSGIDVKRRPEYFKAGNPGIVREGLNEDWKDLALWNWTKLKEERYETILGPYKHWLDFGFDGARADALHFAYNFGNGQKASGDEPGSDFLKELAAVFAERKAFPLAEAFEGKDAEAKRFGFVTVGGDWNTLSTHDSPRPGDFAKGRLAESAPFTAYTLGDEWSDPFTVKEMKDGKSLWRYRIPLPSDKDYKNRARKDYRAQLRLNEAAKNGDVLSAALETKAVLAEAADTFVKHENGGVQIHAASLDWFFEEWGRDTFVSLPGLLLSTGRFEEAKTNIRGFAALENQGLIPNRIGDSKHIEYNTVDGSMWFVQAVQKYVAASGDQAFLQEMLPVMKRVMAAYSHGTGYSRYGRFNKIFMDADGLIVSPAQATWMDADPEGRDQPVTPRYGKAVEINALWYANLRFLAKATGDAQFAQLAGKVKASFNARFWNESAGAGPALMDVVDGDPHGAALRPNMLFAVSHGGDLLSPERKAAVVQAATRDLLTPYGMRTLSPRDSHYQARYYTDKPPLEKDQAYHQGTAWPWLIGAYADALAAVRRDQGWSAEGVKDEAAALLSPLVAFMAASPEGSLPEVFDGGRPIEALSSFDIADARGLSPIFEGLSTDQRRGGTRSQAWSVAEVLRLLSERGLLPK